MVEEIITLFCECIRVFMFGGIYYYKKDGFEMEIWNPSQI